MRLNLRAKSSGAEPYEVEFVIDGNQLSVYCNCQAGSFGKLCKHKTELLAGDTSRLFDETETSKLEELSRIVQRAPEILRLAGEIAQSEKIVRTEQAKLKKAKKQFEASLKQGVELDPS
ncbi:MAG: hypothetical protein KDG50_05080 [Chromatiales bacterium]|nr:hypothetical protein [Chromatiales bacterium]